MNAWGGVGKGCPHTYDNIQKNLGIPRQPADDLLPDILDGSGPRPFIVGHRTLPNDTIHVLAKDGLWKHPKKLLDKHRC